MRWGCQKMRPVRFPIPPSRLEPESSRNATNLPASSFTGFPPYGTVLHVLVDSPEWLLRKIGT